MRVHHLNCGTDRPLGGALLDGCSAGAMARLVCHCLLIETDHGLVLVDTGYGLRDVAEPGRLSRTMRALLNIQLQEPATALRQLEKLGWSARDVRHIIVTHLDFDHAGGLQDFPEAQVHVTAAELEAASDRSGWLSSRRYRPEQWPAFARWRPHTPDGDRWYGFQSVRDIRGLPPEILLVPLAGHTHGHTGVAVETGDGWLLHAGDAYFFHGEVGDLHRRCPPGLRLYQNIMEVDRSARLENQDRLRELSVNAAAGVRMICSHDAVELARCQKAVEVGHAAHP